MTIQCLASWRWQEGSLERVLSEGSAVTLDCLGASKKRHPETVAPRRCWKGLVRNGTSPAHVSRRGCPSGDLVCWETAGPVNGCWARSYYVCPEREKSPNVPDSQKER